MEVCVTNFEEVGAGGLVSNFLGGDAADSSATLGRALATFQDESLSALVWS